MTTQKMTVTYKAPPGDAKVTAMFGHTLFDGKPEEIEVTDEQARKFKNHSLFQIEGHPKPEHDHKKTK